MMRDILAAEQIGVVWRLYCQLYLQINLKISYHNFLAYIHKVSRNQVIQQISPIQEGRKPKNFENY